MSLNCLKQGCKGKVRGRGRGRSERYFTDERYDCAKCGTSYGIEVTDDYEDDCVASLVDPRARSTEKEGGGNG